MLDEVKLVKTLLDIPLFEDLDYKQVQDIMKISTHRVAEPGEVLCEPRTIDDSLTVLITGRLRLETGGGEFLDHQHPVRVIGEMGVFTGQIRSTQVTVDEPSEVLIIDSVQLDEMLEEDPQMGNHLLANLIKLLYGRIYEVNQEMERLRDTSQRLKNRLKEIQPEDPIFDELFPEDSDNG